MQRNTRSARPTTVYLSIKVAESCWRAVLGTLARPAHDERTHGLKDLKRKVLPRTAYTCTTIIFQEVGDIFRNGNDSGL